MSDPRPHLADVQPERVDDSLFRAWTDGLKQAGRELLPLTGLVVPVAEARQEDPDFAFWSIVFTPAGNTITFRTLGPSSAASKTDT